MNMSSINYDLIIEKIETLRPDDFDEILLLLEEADYQKLNNFISKTSVFRKFITAKLNSSKNNEEKVTEALGQIMSPADAGSILKYLNNIDVDERIRHLLSLSQCLSNNELFEEYSRRLLTDSQQHGEDRRKQEVIQKIRELFDVERSVKIILYLEISVSEDERKRHIDNLHQNLNREHFKEYCLHFLTSAQKKENEESFKAFVDNFTQHLKRIVQMNGMTPSLANINQHVVLRCLIDMCIKPNTLQLLTNLIRMSGALLTGAYLTANMLNNVYDWKCGQIDSRKCAIKVLKSMGFVVGGLVGGMAGGRLGGVLGMAIPGAIEGVAVGSVAGPVGMIVGSIAGGYIGSHCGEALVELLCEKVFDLPWQQALNDAYTYFKCQSHACSYELRRAYENICRTARQAERALATAYMAIIRLARRDQEQFSIPEQNQILNVLPPYLI